MNWSRIHKFVAILTVCLIAFLPTDLSADNSEGLKLKTIVLDPGHGGRDAGCVSKDKKTYEKNITLEVATLLKKKINAAYPDVKVIMTRTKDVYLTLNERADIANRNKADLFVSIHVNSVDPTSPHGYSCHILGQSSIKNRDLFSWNMEACKRENSVILLEEDYTTKYQGFDPNDPESFIFFTLMQNAYYEQSLLFAAECDISMSKGPISHSRGISQDPFYVLWKSAMPSVLLEIGFISNPADLKVMRSSSGQDKIATALFNAFKEFKSKYDTSLKGDPSRRNGVSDSKSLTEIKSSNESKSTTSSHSKTEGESINDGKNTVQVENNTDKTISGTIYGTQVLVSGRLLSDNDELFKGYNCYRLKVGNLYKYIIGYSKDETSARRVYKDVKKIFPDAFLVVVTDGQATRVK